MSKQDRQGARTPADLERKYKFGQSFAETMGIATDAQQEANDAKAMAAEAYSAANALDASLDQTEIFNRLTNNGEDQGLYLQDGKVYVNAQYVLSGSFTSTAEVFLEPGLEELETIRAHIIGDAIPNDRIALYDFNNDGVVDIRDLRMCKESMFGNMSLADWTGAVKSTVTVTMDASKPTKSILITGTNMWGREVNLYFGVDGSNLGTVHGNLAVGGKLSVGGELQFGVDDNNNATLSIGTAEPPKKLSWKDNGDGTFTLIGQ